MLEKLKNLIPWLTELPMVPKVIISIVAVLILIFFLSIIWTPNKKTKPEEAKSVIDAYNRMVRVLSRITQEDNGQLYIDKKPIDMKLIDYYSSYAKIAAFVKTNPNQIEKAYEKIWEHGGQGRVFINATSPFETVVSAFFMEFENAKSKSE